MSGPTGYTEEFRIPNNLVGLVIGRGGEQIKKLQQESNCKIRIASEGDGTPMRACTLQGSQEQIEHAKRLLDEVVQRGQSREQNNGGGRGGYGGGAGRGGFGGGQRRQYNNEGGYGNNGGNGGYGGANQEQNNGYRR